MSSISLSAVAADRLVDGDVLVGDFVGAGKRGGGALAARAVAHRGSIFVERPFQIDGGRPRRRKRRTGALQVFVGGVLAQRQPHAVGRGRPDQRRAAHLHRFDGVRGIGERLEPRGGEAMRQQRLVDDADAFPVALQPDRAHVFAVDFHGSFISRFQACAKLRQRRERQTKDAINRPVLGPSSGPRPTGKAKMIRPS